MNTKQKRGRRLVLMLAALALILGMTVVGAPAASASVGCYGDYCSGKDPMSTGCANGAYTVSYKDLSGARIEIRWSPTCKTNWARWNQYPIGFKSDILIVLAAVQDTGYTQSHNYGVNGVPAGTYWSNMIYSPVHAVKAVATIQCGGISMLGTAFDCLTNGKVETGWA